MPKRKTQPVELEKTRGPKMPVLLTPRQVQILRYIRDYRRMHHCSPTLQELAGHLQLSKVTIFEHVEALIRKGLIHREANKARTLTVHPRLKLNGDMEPAEPAGVVVGTELPAGGSSPAGIPLLGTIAAGVPMEAVENSERLDLNGMFEGEEVFALKVRGESMIEDHIRDGDFVVVRKGNQARDGQAVVAVLENGEATLKKVYRQGNGYLLKGANPQFKPIFINELMVQGVVVGIVRKVN